MPRRMPQTKKNPTKAQSIGLYRKVVISFVVLTVILIAVVLYFSFVSAKIIVTARPEKVIADFSVKMVEGKDGLLPDQTNAVFFSKEVSGAKDFPATGVKSAVSDIVGRVTIVNNYRRPQPLVATTRLLSPDNILLRLKDRVDVPVGGSVEADVYADNPDQLKGRVLPAGTKFTIPGLFAQLQDKIYAQASGTIHVGENKITVVTADDIKNAKDQMLDQLQMQAFIDLGMDGNVAKAVNLKEESAQASAKAGDAVSKFNLKVKALISGVLFDKDSLIKLAASRLRDNLPKDKQLLSTDYNTLTYNVENMDLKAKTATVQVHLEGTSTIRLSSQIFEKNKLKGLTKEQLGSYFADQPSVDSVRVDFFPFWVQRVPELPDHFEVTLK